jgi:hypothetical protein
LNRTFAAALVVALVTSCSGKPKQIAAAEDAIRYQLIDPKSADFRNTFAAKSGVVCGEVNSKNRFGGYVGFREFYYDPAAQDAEIDPNESLSQDAREMFGNITEYVMDTTKFVQLRNQKCSS